MRTDPPGPRPTNGQGATGWSPEADELAARRALGDPLGESDPVEAGIQRLRDEAARMARAEAEAGVPLPEAGGLLPGEAEIRERCRAAWQRWRSAARRRRDDESARIEEQVVGSLGKAGLAIDRFERLANDLTRLRVRVTTRRHEVVSELAREKTTRTRGIPTKVYLLAIAFLGVVEFFANAPVFTSLLPRDPLTERQIRLVSEGAMGWTSGAGRVLSHIVLRPDAALLAAGVVTFLCVLAHFFGHSLRELVMHTDRRVRRDTVSGRSPMENVVPMIITGIGLALVLGVLYESRVMLGNVGQERFEQDVAQVEELRRQAGWARVDGNLLEANGLENRADDLEEAATDLQEYASSMARMSFPILLLNLTLVLCAIAAAYFHRRDSRKEQFNEDPYEEDRKVLVESAENVAAEVSETLSGLIRDLRRLRGLAAGEGEPDWSSAKARLDGVVVHYRTESARARGVDPRGVEAFRAPYRLELSMEDLAAAGGLREPHEYEKERSILASRFEGVRRRFTEEATAS
jgi:hypothetical protein